MQNIHYREAYVKSYEVGQRKRSHRMVHPKLHNSINALACCHAFVERKYCLINHGHEYTV